jgi:hypothetical protein
MTVLKNWWELDIDADNLNSFTKKHNDWNLVFAHHKEEDKIYPLMLAEITDAQHKDQGLKVYFKKNAKYHKRTWVSSLLRTPKCYAKMES